jgi:hypothetical protein
MTDMLIKKDESSRLTRLQNSENFILHLTSGYGCKYLIWKEICKLAAFFRVYIIDFIFIFIFFIFFFNFRFFYKMV